MLKIWKKMALNKSVRGAKITFTINKLDDKGVIDIIQINTIFMPSEVYNTILRDKKIQSLVEGDGSVTVQDMYFAMLKYGENYHVDLVEFERIT